MKSLLVNDITLRDGEQAPGVNFFPDEKLRIAEQLVDMGLPIIEAGFPIASEDDIFGDGVAPSDRDGSLWIRRVHRV